MSASPKPGFRAQLRTKSFLFRIGSVALWLLVWQLASMWIGQEILLVSPVCAIDKLIELMGTGAFYQAILFSFGRILLGFALALVLGVVLAVLSCRFRAVAYLLTPPMSVIKATPVASFVILALVLMRAANLSVFISFLMVLPVIYVNVVKGLDSADTRLLQMAQVFAISPARVVRAVYAPAAYPYLLAACQTSLGMCWKAGIAAEVIGQPNGSIGDMLYRAKIFLATDSLFAWTLAIILLSVLFERLVLFGVNRLLTRYEGGAASAD